MSEQVRPVGTYAASGLMLRAAAPWEMEHFNKGRSTPFSMREQLHALHRERSEYVANRFTIVSQGDEALQLRLTISSNEQEHFGLVLAVGYKLEDHRPLRHRSIFNVLDLHHHYVRGVGTTYEQGTVNYRPQEELAAKLSPANAWLLEVDGLRDF